jgi:F-type H+-transporting ATPase subunit delta
VVQDLLGAKALQTSVALAEFVVASGRAGEMADIVDRFVELAARERRHGVAEVRSAVPLTDDQIDRLRVALNHATDKELEVKVVVDPTVMGGLVARIGDVVIDGSVRHRLEQLKEQI